MKTKLGLLLLVLLAVMLLATLIGCESDNEMPGPGIYLCLR